MGFQGVQLTRFDWDAFWDDGTVRTVGREYNGLAVSPCASKGKLQCTSCHEMHGSDPENQLKPGHDGDHACAVLSVTGRM